MRCRKACAVLADGATAEVHMTPIPDFVRFVFVAFVPCFTAPTLERFILLALAAIITTGSRTVNNLLRTLGSLAYGHPGSYHHLFSSRRWLCWRLARTLATLLVERFVPSGVVHLVGDDTVFSHPGPKVYGKGRHRDAVRSSHSYTAFHYGHKWVVLALLVRVPFSRRAWALPILVALYRTKQWNTEFGKRHRTPPEIMQGLLAVAMRWLPQRRLHFVGDGGFATQRLANFASQHQNQLTLTSRFYSDAVLYEPAPLRQRGQQGRPRIMGRKLPTPKEIVAGIKARQRLTVSWYGGEKRQIDTVSGTGLWYRSGHGLVKVRWVFVHDMTGTHRDEYFFTTDTRLNSKSIVESYTGRWNIETTFQDLQANLKIGSTRCRTKNSILTSVPCLFGLYSVVVLLYAQINPYGDRKFAINWRGKTDVAFSDAIAAVRKEIWAKWIFKQDGYEADFEKIPAHLRENLLNLLSVAA